MSDSSATLSYDINLAEVPRFVNLDPRADPRPARAFKWAVSDRIFGRRRRSPRGAEVAVVPAVVPERDRDSVLWLGHSSALITLAGLRVLTDPVFWGRVGPAVRRNVPPPWEPDAIADLDVVLVSHNHRDHLDRTTILAIERACHPLFVVPLGVERYLHRWKIEATRVISLPWWGRIKPLGDELAIQLVPAQHWSQRTPFDRNKTLWGGFVVEARGRAVYFAGDTGYFSGFSEIGRRVGHIDLALLPIGAYDPEWFMQPQHINPEQAGQAMLDLGAARMLSIHWGTYKLTDEPLDEPPIRLEAWRRRAGVARQRVLTLPVGGLVDLEPGVF